MLVRISAELEGAQTDKNNQLAAPSLESSSLPHPIRGPPWRVTATKDRAYPPGPDKPHTETLMWSILNILEPSKAATV